MYKMQVLGVQFSSIFAITPRLYMFFALKVLHMAIDIAVHFYGTMKFSYHECSYQLSYLDHLGYHYINLCFH